MKSAKVLLLLSIALVLGLAACGGGGGGDSPDKVTENFVTALFKGDTDKIGDYVCEAMQANVADMQEFYADMSENPIDVSGLSYETTSEEGDNATVRITGEISIEVEGETTTLPIGDMFSEEMVLVKEDGKWKVCE